MPYKTGSLIKLLFTLVLLAAAMPTTDGYAQFEFPPPPPPEQFGNVLINRTSEKNGVKPVVFSHWIHRRKFTCRVCHFEIDFSMRTNATEITEEGNRKGMFCGTCHNGKEVFGHDQANCAKCHSGDRSAGKEKFAELEALPAAKFGNGRDWVKALESGAIKPRNFLQMKPSEDITFDKPLLLEADWFNIPPAVFSHKVHTDWLDCNNCHPDVFNIKKKTTKHFEMRFILEGQFCGVCHLNVAFPMQDCKRCHPPAEKRPVKKKGKKHENN